jgi:hypothetical protein
MGSRVFRRAAAVAVVMAAGLAASGCNSSPAGSKTAAKLMPEVQALARGAKSVHITGSAAQGTETVTMDVSFSGSSAAGTVAVNGASFSLMLLSGRAFIKLNAAFLKEAKLPASTCATVCGKYVQLPAATMSQLTGALSMKALVNQAFSNKSMDSAASSRCVFSPATLNGQSVLQCRQGAYTVDVAAHGNPYLLLITGPNGEHIAFSDWNSVTLLAPPPASQVISLSNLG